MPSVHEIKCPICGVEDAPCLIENGMNMYHIERKRAAYPTTYEHPDCAECRTLKDAMEYAADSYRTYRPGFGARNHKPKSRWPKNWRDESHRLEMAANLSRASYEVHLATFHNDENRLHDLPRNVTVVMRKGRVRP